MSVFANVFIASYGLQVAALSMVFHKHIGGELYVKRGAHSSKIMPKKKEKHSNGPKSMSLDINKTSEGPITSSKDGCNILMKILAKPGAKMNCIKDISDDGIAVQINAPPVEGEANSELINYISKIIGIKKSDIRISRGGKSRHKTLELNAATTSPQEISEKLNTTLQKNKN